MTTKSTFKNIFKEAELYRSQGLLKDAVKKYFSALELIEKNAKIKDRQNLMNTLSKKIQDIQNDIKKFDGKSVAIEVTEKAQDIIIKNFTFSSDKNKKIIESAQVLIKFGQTDRAVKELSKLLSDKSYSLTAAKNILRCYIQSDLIDKALNIYKSWIKPDKKKDKNKDIFLFKQKINLKDFFQKILDDNKDKTKLDEIKPPQKTIESNKKDNVKKSNDLEKKQKINKKIDFNEDFMEISAVKIIIQPGKNEKLEFEFDVDFQSGNLISMMIPEKERGLIDYCTNHEPLNDMQFFSPIAVFNGKGEVKSISEIESGPKKGNYSLSLLITNS